MAITTQDDGRSDGRSDGRAERALQVRAADARGFSPSMLLNDKRYRGITLQVIALAAIAFAIWWLGSNVVAKLGAQGRDFSFAFLWSPASYDIDQTLIDYSSRSPHWRAALVGILNTLLVAFLGIVFATILGVTAGIGRLSSNWLVARLMTVYVELFRNVPVLIWIVISIAIFTTVFPTPRQAWTLGGGLGSLLELLTFGIYDGDPIGQVAVFTNRGVRLTAPEFLPGSGLVVLVFFASLVGAWLFRRYARARQERTGDIVPWKRFAALIVIVPTVVAFLALGRPIGLDVPELQGFNFSGGWRMSGALFALWLGLSVYTGAFIAEVVRSGIQAVSKGQTEAALAVGLPPKRVMNLVVLPQALRVIIPPLISQYLNLTKNSSLAIATGYFDITGTLGGVTLNQTGRAMECIILLMLFYLTISLVVSAVMNAYNGRVALKER